MDKNVNMCVFSHYSVLACLPHFFLLKSGNVCLRVSIAVKRPHDHSNSYKKNVHLGFLAYSIRGSVHYHHRGEHSAVQADMVLATS